MRSTDRPEDFIAPMYWGNYVGLALLSLVCGPVLLPIAALVLLTRIGGAALVLMAAIAVVGFVSYTVMKEYERLK